MGDVDSNHPGSRSNAIREAYPQTLAGDLAAEQLVVSCYGMIITYFTCQGIIEKVLADNPLTRENLQVRRKHLKEMFAIITRAIKEDGKDMIRNGDVRKEGTVYA